MCLKKRPYATKLEPLHVCKDENQNDYTDASFFQALNTAYYKQRSLKERSLFRLKRIEFVEVKFLNAVSELVADNSQQFELCPEDLVDYIIPDKLPPTTEEYDFAPPPPPRKYSGCRLRGMLEYMEEGCPRRIRSGILRDKRNNSSRNDLADVGCVKG
jgi:hypothetical protein